MMDDPNITMEEYIENEEEKARRHSKVYNWETATYGKIWSDEDVHNLISVETKFIAILYNDAFTFEVVLSCEPTSICLRFRHPNLRSVILMILTTSRIVEKEFPAITYNDALTSKLDFSEPTGFTATLAVLITEASQSRQHGMSKPILIDGFDHDAGPLLIQSGS
nr:hypothetical protein [Tanacetum cinerariifolium]